MVRHFIVVAAFAAALTPDAVTVAQQAANPQLVAVCVQSQQQAMAAVDAANRRIELARQTNQPAAMRAAMDDLQSALSAMRTQLAPCAELRAAAAPSAAPGMANMPGMANVSSPAPAAAPGGHDMANMPTATSPAAADPHAGHVAAAAPSVAAANANAGHVMPAAPAAHASHAAAAAPAAGTRAVPAAAAESVAVDPICGLKVHPADAPTTTYQGHPYYFCSEQHRQSFLKAPAKYVPKERRCPRLRR